MNHLKNNRGLLISVIVILALISFFGLRADILMLLGKRFTIGEYIGYSPVGGRNGGSWQFKFMYNGVEYNSSYKEIGKAPKYVFIKFYPSNAKFNKIVFKPKVPVCANAFEVPIEGWTEIPKNICNE